MEGPMLTVLTRHRISLGCDRSSPPHLRLDLVRAPPFMPIHSSPPS